MAVAADDCHAGQGEALFRPDDMHNALTAVVLVVIFDAEFAGVGGELFDLRLALRVFDRQRAVGRRHIVVDDGESLLRRADLAARHAQPLEGLRTRHFMDEMAIDIEEAGAVVLAVDDMVVPDLVVKRARRGRI